MTGAIVIDVERDERYWYPDEGGAVWLAGFSLVDPSGRYVGRDDPELVARGLRIASVAGAARHHNEALRAEALEPGSRLVLRRDAGNPHDPNAIAVDSIEGRQVGWVPREIATDVAPGLDSGRPWSAVVLRESRPSPRDARTGLTMLLGPAVSIVLRERGLR